MNDFKDVNHLNGELLDEEKVLWESIVSRVQPALRLSDEETEAMKNHKLIRMFGLLPKFADCPNPEGTGFMNVVVYMAERNGGRDLFLHHPEHDRNILSRLQPFHNIMRKGNQEVVEKGLALASLVMLQDYQADREEDLAKNKYNPLNNGAWEFSSARAQLMKVINKAQAMRLDAVFALSVVTTMSFWNNTGY